MTQPDLFILAGMHHRNRISFGDENLATLKTAHPHARVELVYEPEEFSRLLPEADAVLTMGFAHLLAPALAPGGRLRWVQALNAGVDALLRPEVVAAEHVTITSSKGPMGPQMAEHAIMLMLALGRSLPAYTRDQVEHRWRTYDDLHPMWQLRERTLAILGVGAVGGNLARAARLGFDMRVVGYDLTRRDSPHVDRYADTIPDAVAEADYVVVCLPLTPTTRNIIDAGVLAAMKPTAFFVNIARGGLIDGEALLAALRSGQIAGAGLDAPPGEPLKPGDPLWDLPNVIITPHVAPARDLVGADLAAFWCENIRRFAEGEPLMGLVDRHAGF